MIYENSNPTRISSEQGKITLQKFFGLLSIAPFQGSFEVEDLIEIRCVGVKRSFHQSTSSLGGPFKHLMLSKKFM